MKGKDLVKVVLKDWAKDSTTLRRRANLDYPILYFKKGVKIEMMLLNRLYGIMKTDHVNQYWVPLLGEIIINDRKINLFEVLAYKLHTNWEISKLG